MHDDTAHTTGFPAALDAALDAARLAEPVFTSDANRQFVILPRGMQLEAVPDPDRPAPFIRQSVTVDEATSLSSYINRFASPRSIILADYVAGTITARLDYHSGADADESLDPIALKPGRNSHVATLKLQPSEEFRRWSAIEGDELLDQEAFARFLEENADEIRDPEPGVMIEISRDLEATQSATFKGKTRLENGDTALAYETETLVKTDVVIPRTFTIEIPLFNGEPPVAIECLFRWRARGDGMKMGFVWRRVEYLRRAHFEQIAHRVADETTRPLYFGRTG